MRKVAIPRLPKGTVIGSVGCGGRSCQEDVPIKIGEKGKAYAYCIQQKNKAGKIVKGCGWRTYWGRHCSDGMIDDYLEGQTDHDDTNETGDQAETEDQGGGEIEAAGTVDAGAGDGAGEPAGKRGRNPNVPEHWQ